MYMQEEINHGNDNDSIEYKLIKDKEELYTWE